MSEERLVSLWLALSCFGALVLWLANPPYGPLGCPGWTP